MENEPRKLPITGKVDIFLGPLKISFDNTAFSNPGPVSEEPAKEIKKQLLNSEIDGLLCRLKEVRDELDDLEKLP